MTDKRPCVFIQNNKQTALYGIVAKTARELGCEVIDRSMTEEFDADNCGVNWDDYGPVLIYGSVDFVAACGRSEKLKQYLFNDRDSMAMSVLNEKMGGLIFNHGGKVHSVEVVSLFLSGWLSLTLEDRMFIRPDAAHKAFNGGLYNRDEWVKIVKENNLSKDLMCWVAAPMFAPSREFRAWVIDWEIVAVSQYMENGEITVMEYPETTGFGFRAKKVMEALKNSLYDSLPKCMVVDFAIPKGKGWDDLKIMEINCINSSGFYGTRNIETIITRWMNYLTKDHSDFKVQEQLFRKVSLWEDDLIQFARLICEINATQSTIDIEALMDSMDLPRERVLELFERAESVWTHAKDPRNRSVL